MTTKPKRILSLLLCCVMLIGLLPTAALADGSDDPQVVYGKYEGNTWVQDDSITDGSVTDPETGITLSKTATPTDTPNVFEITLTVQTSTTTTAIGPSAAATVLVIDLSNSMYYCAECGNSTNINGTYYHNTDCGKSTGTTQIGGGRDQPSTTVGSAVQTEDTRLYAAKAAAMEFLESYAGDNAAANRLLAIVGFGTSARTFLSWYNVAGGKGENSYDAAVAAIESLAPGFTNPVPNPDEKYTAYEDSGGTNLQAGLQLAANLSAMDDVAGMTKNVIALTDGIPTYRLSGAADTASTAYLGIKQRSETTNKGPNNGGNQQTTYFWDEDIAGSGINGSSENNSAAASAATNVKRYADLYTVCFGVSDSTCYDYGPTVGDFLRESVATAAAENKTYAFDAGDADELYTAFEAITSTITSGLDGSGLTVTDPMGPDVTCTLPTGVTGDENGFSWTLGDPVVSTEGNVTTYTYTLTYTITLDTTGVGFDEDAYHPVNGDTYLTVNNEQLHFPVPAVKGVVPRYTVTYDGAAGTLAGEDENGQVVHTNLKMHTATPAAPEVTAPEHYCFTGWLPTVDPTVTGNVTYVAQYAPQGNVTVTANSDTVTYDGAPHFVRGVTVAGLPEGYSIDYTASASGTDASTYTSFVTGSGTITDTEGNDVSEQFYVTTANGTLTINKRAVTLTSATDSKEYDGTALTNDTVTVGGDGWAEGEGATYTVNGSQKLPGSSSNAFTYSLNEGTKADNYTITTENGTLKVIDRTNKFEITVEANSGEFQYDGEEHSVSGFKTLEFEFNGVTFTVEGLTAETKATENGIYPVEITGTPVIKDADGADVTAQFKVTAVNGELEIYSKQLTVTKSVNKTTASPGDTLKYTIIIKNTSTRDMQNISLTEILMAGNEKIASLDLYNEKGEKVNKIDMMRANEEVTLYATYKVTNSDVGKTLVNTVSAVDPNDNGGAGSSKGTEIVYPYIPPVIPSKPILNCEDHIAYIIGYEDGTVRPQNNITRAEVATIFFRLLSDESRADFWSQESEYSDVKLTDWFNNAVSTLSNAGIITGYPDGSFNPNASITRAEFAAIAARFSEVVYNEGCTFTDVPENHWAARFIALAEHLGWITGYPDGSFRPDQAITRAEAMTLINRVLERTIEEEHMLPDMVTWEDNLPGDWFYEAVQEATNSHEYTRLNKPVSDQDFNYEDWAKILPVPDWAGLEKIWSTANSK